MAKICAIQMDPLASVNPATDTSLLLGQEAQRRGYALYHYLPSALTYDGGALTAAASRVTLHDDRERYYEIHESLTLDLGTVDVVLLRQDPPFDMAYITTTYLLERLSGKTLVVNNPAAVRDCPEKLFPLRFAQFMPPTLVSADPDAIASFLKAQRDIVLKPLYGFGGRQVLRLRDSDGNLSALAELMFSHVKTPWMAQLFLPEVASDDRRILLIDGEVAGIMGRIPATGEIRANFRAGGRPAKAELTRRQREICDAVGPVLKEKGLLLAGIDVIGDYLTEINLTSPTGLIQMNALYGLKLESQFWDAVENYLIPVSHL